MHKIYASQVFNDWLDDLKDQMAKNKILARIDRAEEVSKMAINQEALEKLGFRPFDMAEHLKTDEDIAGYLTEILAEGDMDALLKALNTVARARGMSQVAEPRMFLIQPFTASTRCLRCE